MDEHKKQFLNDAFLSLAVNYALQRCRTYREDVEPKARHRFREALRQQLAELARQYTTDVSKDDHIENIKHLADSLSKDFAHALVDRRFRIGSAQKALNLYLKYLWCADLIHMPPHCPFDRTIIDHLPGCRHIKWTALDSIEDYKLLVEAARAQADGVPLAQWELKTYTSAT